MHWHFNDIQNMNDFVKHLSSELDLLGEDNWSIEINRFTTTFYTTSSEYLGELRITLKKLLNEKPSILPEELKKDVDLAINAIKKAFGQ